jgi:hypothetical protein
MLGEPVLTRRRPRAQVHALNTRGSAWIFGCHEAVLVEVAEVVLEAAVQ